MVRQRVRIRFRKQGDLRFVGHRDLVRSLERLFRARAGFGDEPGISPQAENELPVGPGRGNRRTGRSHGTGAGRAAKCRGAAVAALLPARRRGLSSLRPRSFRPARRKRGSPAPATGCRYPPPDARRRPSAWRGCFRPRRTRSFGPSEALPSTCAASWNRLRSRTACSRCAAHRPGGECGPARRAGRPGTGRPGVGGPSPDPHRRGAGIE